jgi:hypothetical protein
MLLPASLAYLRPRAYDRMIRVGSAHDGGYLLPEAALADAQMLLSFGLWVNWEFEAHLRRLRPGLPVHVYDHTVDARLFAQRVAGAALRLARRRGSARDLAQALTLPARYRRFFRGEVRHFRERITGRRDDDGDATIDLVFERAGDARPVIVKMDIEGAEYRVVDALVRHAERIDVLLIEFHDTDPLRPVFESAMRRLLTVFELAHLHANNHAGRAADGLPDVLEVTLAHPRLGRPAQWRDRLPLPGLDAPCRLDRPDLELEFASA